MRKLVATVSGVAVAICVGVAICSPAQPAPVTCPIDMRTDAGKQALQQSTDQFTARVVALEKEMNDAHPNDGLAYSKSPGGIAQMAQGNQFIKDRDDQAKLCWDSLIQPLSTAPAPAAPAFSGPCPNVNDVTAAALQEANAKDWAAYDKTINDYNSTIPSCGGGVQPLPADHPKPQPPPDPNNCEQVVGHPYDVSPGEKLVTGVADAAAGASGIPGPSDISGAAAGSCAVNNVPNAIKNGNWNQVGVGACGAVSDVTGGLPDLLDVCGDQPAG